MAPARVPLGLMLFAAALACAGCGDDSRSSLTPSSYSLELLWSDRFASAVPYDVVAADGVAVVSGRAGGLGAAYEDYLVRAYDGATGSVRWQDRIDAGCNSAAGETVAQAGRVIVAGNVCERFVLRAYDVRTGGLLWERRGSADFESGANGLLIASDVLVLFGWGAGAAFIRAYDPSSGRPIWERRSEAISVSGRTDGTILVTSHYIRTSETTFSHVFRAYALATGEPLWELTEIGGEPIGVPYETAMGEGLFVSYRETRDDPPTAWLAAIDVETAELVWQTPVSLHRLYSKLLISRRCLHTAGVEGVYDEARDVWRNALHVSCVEPGSGDVVWEDRRTSDSGADFEAIDAVRDGRRLAIVGFEIELWVYDGITGELAYESLNRINGRGGPIASDAGVVYVIAEDFPTDESDTTGALIRAYRESSP